MTFFIGKDDAMLTAVKFWKDRAGAIAVIFAVMLPAIVSAVGMSMDMAEGYLVRTRLSGALDAAALAATAAETDDAAIEERVHDFMEANYPEDKIGVAYDIDVDFNGDDVTVSAYADYNTSFMKIVGIDQITVYRQTTVTREVRGLEVVLVLDNTGSMQDADKIGALREAATNFVNILFDATDEPEYIRIGIVPYANSVRIGRYGLGLNPDGTPYEVDGEAVDPFVTLPAGVSYTTSSSSSTGWYGCVVEHNDENYDEDAIMVSGSYGQLWTTDGAACGATNCNGHGWDPAQTDNDPYPQDVTDDYEGPWDIYMKGTISSSRTCLAYDCRTWSGSVCTRYWTTSSHCASWGPYSYSFSKSSSPNSGCPYAMVQPLISDQDTLLADIQGLQEGGNTRSDAGIVWGYRMLSPEPPFTEGHDWDDVRWRKAIVVMTDGMNTRDGTYSYDWVSSKNQVGPTGCDGTNTTCDDYNDRFQEVCSTLKDNDVLVYTIILGTGGLYSEPDDTTKAVFRECANTPSQYYDAPSNEELIAAFENISHQLANLHISQ